MRKEGSIMKPKDIMTELLREFGIRASYSVALRARNNAIEMIYGGQDVSFQILPSYLHVLRQNNPGTMTDLDIGTDGRFQHLFVALGACRAAYATSLRPVIVMDCTHLKGRNKGILFVAVTKDGNEQCFPLAVGVGPIENDVSWTWFMERLKVAFRVNPDMLIVSYQHISISNAINNVFPNTTHGLCYYHLLKKLTSYGGAITSLFCTAAYTYRQSVYEKTMKSIDAISLDGAHARLIRVGPEKWARSQCRVRRYGFLTSNAAESFNGRLSEARRLPICSLIEAIRHVIEQWFDQRRSKASFRENNLTEEVVRKLSADMERARTYNVVSTTTSTFKVETGHKTYIVNL